MSDSTRISPTAFATGYFWYRHGLSHEALATPEGRRLDRHFGWLIRGIRLISGVSLDDMMLARHRGIDAVLAREIDAGRVSQVIELAAGLSGRGLRFRQRYGERLAYVETDLPHMAAKKRELVGHLLRPGHRIEEVDALADDGGASLPAIAATLDPAQGTAIITEGLLSYLAPDAADALWHRIARTLSSFRHGVYLSDAYIRDQQHGVGMLAFRSVLQRFVRGRMYVHYTSVAQAQARLQAAGFAQVALHETRSLPGVGEAGERAGGRRVRVLEASVKPGGSALPR